MRGIYILAEGPTEEEFINNLLRLYFHDKFIYDIRAILMQTSPGHKGGDVSYQRYKNNAQNLLKKQKDIIVTSLIDYYRLKNDFPNYIESSKISNKKEKLDFLEKAITDDINHPRMVPYIQLHEFEGLLFSSPKGFEELFGDIPERDKRQLMQIVQENPDPEMINDRPGFAPSERLMQLIPGYNKPLYGAMIALVNGFDVLMEKCSRFKNWIEILIEKAQAK